jgi:hypothetical protein
MKFHVEQDDTKNPSCVLCDTTCVSGFFVSWLNCDRAKSVVLEKQRCLFRQISQVMRSTCSRDSITKWQKDATLLWNSTPWRFSCLPEMSISFVTANRKRNFLKPSWTGLLKLKAFANDEIDLINILVGVEVTNCHCVRSSSNYLRLNLS